MSKVAPAGDILDEAERLTATPGIHYDYAIVVPKVSPAYLKELKERVEHAGFVTEEFDALSGQYEVSVLKLGAPQRPWVRAPPGRARAPRPAKLGRPRRLRSAPRVQREARRRARLVARVPAEAGPLPPVRLHAVVCRRRPTCSAFVDTTRHKVILRMLCASSKLPVPARGAGWTPRHVPWSRRRYSRTRPIKRRGLRISTLILLHDHDKRDRRTEWQEL